MRAARLVDAVGEPAADEPEVAAREPEHEQRGVADVVDGVGHRDPARQRLARLGRADGLRRARRAGTRARAAARSAPRGRPRTARSRRAAPRRRCPDGPRGGSPRASTSAPSSKIESAATSPATNAAALVPRPPESGMSERIVNSKSSGGCSAAKPRTHRLRRSRAIRRFVWTAKRPVSTTSTSMCRSSAAPITSKPGPRLAEDAGTRTVRLRFTRARRARPPRCPARRARPRRPG